MINGAHWNELTAQQLVRYEALFKLLDEIQSLENIDQICRLIASRWKYFANVTRWRLVLLKERGFMTIDGLRGEATITECAELSQWDLHFYQLQYPRLLRKDAPYDGPEVPEIFNGNEIIEIQVLPFIRMNTCIGLLSVAARHEPFTDIDNKFIRIFGNYFANRIAEILFRRQATEALMKRATIDSLTNLLNRGQIIERLGNQIAIARHSNEPLSIALADIDHFKKINDTYGHLAGDEVLREISLRLQKQTRTSDFVGRYGGEEFLFVFYPCNEEIVLKATERIRAYVAQTPITIGEKDPVEINVTISIGTSSLKQGTEISVETFLARADRALYRSKDNGRNCINSEN
jgi:diguanylate cyclase (GGDEF)-like protein